LTPLRWLLVLVSFAAAAGVALWVISSHWPEGGAPLGLSWWAHLLALGAVTFELTLRSAKIALSARACGIPLQFGTAARATLGGDFATAITPARVGAEPARFLVLREAGVPAARALLVLFLELFIELLSLVIIAGLLLAFLPASGALKGVAAMVGGYATIVLGLGFGGWVLSRRRAHGPPPRWARAIGIGAGFWRAVQLGLRNLRGSVDALRHARFSMMAASLACSIAHISGRLMTLPIIIIASRAALKAVPPSIREAALGVGASKMQTVTHHVLPLAMPGMLTGTIIGMAHALGETAPLLMIGMVAFIVDIPGSPVDPATVLPVQVYLWADSAERAFVERTSAAIMVLLVFLICMNLLAIVLRKRFERRW